MTRFAAWAAAWVLGVSFATDAATQKYPVKSVRLIVPYAPGGGVDILGRITALGAQAGGGTPLQFKEMLQKEIAKWKGVLAPAAD